MSASQSRTAVSTSVSSTRCRSSVDWLIAFSTSLDADWKRTASSRSRVRSRNASSSAAMRASGAFPAGKVLVPVMCA